MIAAAIVLIPGAPLIPILFLSQALNAVLSLFLFRHSCAGSSCGSRGEGSPPGAAGVSAHHLSIRS